MTAVAIIALSVAAGLVAIVGTMIYTLVASQNNTRDALVRAERSDGLVALANQASAADKATIAQLAAELRKAKGDEQAIEKETTDAIAAPIPSDLPAGSGRAELLGNESAGIVASAGDVPGQAGTADAGGPAPKQ